MVNLDTFRHLYPWTGKHLDVGGGVRMHYLDEGPKDAPPMVMLHGNPTWSFYWRHLVSAFSDRFRCIVPDHVGCGLSDKPGDDRYDYVLERRVSDVEKLLDHAGVEGGITLVVHDWGGMIGLSYALRHLHRIERLVVLNTAGFGLPPGRILPWQIAVARYLPLEVPIRGLNLFVRGAAATCSTVPGRMTPEVKAGYVAPYDSWANRIAVQRFVEDIPLERGDRSFPLVDEVSRNLGRLAEKPILMAWGAKDFVFDDHFLAEWRRRLPHAQVNYFPDAGHYVLEDAHERIVPLIEKFVA